MDLENYTKVVQADGSIIFTPIKPDPYKEFKAALTRGEKVWFKTQDIWTVMSSGDFCYPVECYSLTDPTPKNSSPKIGEAYWFVASCGAVKADKNMQLAIDEERFNFNNVFKSQAQAEKAAELQRRSNAIIRACLLVDPDYELDWCANSPKWAVYFNAKSDFNTKFEGWLAKGWNTEEHAPAYVSTKEKALEVCELLTKWGIK